MRIFSGPNGTKMLVGLLVALVVVPALVAAAIAGGNHPIGSTVTPTQSASASVDTTPDPVPTSYSEVVKALDAGKVTAIDVDDATGAAEVTFSDGTLAKTVLPADDGPLLRQLADSGANVTVAKRSTSSGEKHSLVAALLPPLLLVGLLAGWIALSRRRARNGGGALGAPNMGLRSTAQVEPPSVMFADVAGCDEAVEELAEVVEFFRNPTRFAQLGAKMPSGIILYGEPGTGKTLLAKALAGEAGLAFYATSGSDFVEKFVGVGASRVRELFAKARAHEGGAVVFIDEIDAVGRMRSQSEANGEREQTLNQILVELDGFSPNDRVVCIAATNRLDVLDPALLRPGRFGRHIAVPLPSAEGRSAILRVHSAGKPLATDVDIDELAHSMGGLSGAQLADVVNEAAIVAGRAESFVIERSHFREGYLRVLAGPKRRSAPLAQGELEVIATHEAGHVICAEFSEHYEKAQQVTVEPRGQAMGLAVYGQVDRALYDPDYLHDGLVATLGGRAAEQIAFNRISSGAANDLQKATELARRAVEELGFSPRLGQIVAGRAPFADSTRSIVDAEIERMVADAYADALTILTEHREELDRLRERLVQQRELERVDILAAIGSRLRALPRRLPRPVPRPFPALGPEGMPVAAVAPKDKEAA